MLSKRLPASQAMVLLTGIAVSTVLSFLLVDLLLGGLVLLEMN
jgi:hypothetical protein